MLSYLHRRPSTLAHRHRRRPSEPDKLCSKSVCRLILCVSFVAKGWARKMLKFHEDSWKSRQSSKSKRMARGRWMWMTTPQKSKWIHRAGKALGRECTYIVWRKELFKHIQLLKKAISLLVSKSFSSVGRDIAVNQIKARPKAQNDVQGQHYRYWQVHKHQLVHVACNR